MKKESGRSRGLFKPCFAFTACFVLMTCLLFMAGCSKSSSKKTTEQSTEFETSYADPADELLVDIIDDQEPETIIKVGLVDTGVSTDAIDPDCILPGYNYITGDDDTEDTYHHGTASASIILNYAPYAEIVPMVCTALVDGKAKTVDSETLAQIITDAVDIYECDVLCVSVGIRKKNEVLEEAVNHAEKAGVVILAPVGNSNEEHPKYVYYPAAYKTVLGIGALNQDGTDAASYSQRGKSVSLMAAGIMPVVSMSGEESVETGTSVAAACATGAVVRILQKKPDMEPAAIRQLLFDTAKDLDKKGYDKTTGYGAIDLDAALESLEQ